MEWNLPGLLSALRHSLQSPRDAMRQVIDSDPPMVARWIALVLVAIASTFLMLLSLAPVPAEELPPALLWAMASPLGLAAVHAAMLLVSVHLLYRLGRFRNGRGSFADSLTVLIWFQIIMLAVQAVQLAVQVALPVLAFPAYLAGTVLFFWLLTNFVAELHGFASLTMTLFGILVALAVLILVLGFGLAVIFAVTVGVPAP
ncbi:MAG: YIP1 family protein [Rhodobacter sp.]|nr:YIP1 family protein [Rhodobacter sp.]